MSLYKYVPHPHIARRKQQGPVKVADQIDGVTPNGRIAVRLTALVGTMTAAYLFAGIALLALPSVLGYDWLPPRTLLIVAWISQTFIQLVMLAVLQIGQNLQAKGADARAQQTYLDAEAVLAEALKIQEHLAVQDELLAKLAPLEQQVTALTLGKLGG
jgi:hypothetical protein